MAGERLVLSWSRGWGEVVDGGVQPFEPPIPDRLEGPGAVAFDGDRVLGIATTSVPFVDPGMPSLRTLLIERAAMESSSTDLTELTGATGVVATFPWFPPRHWLDPTTDGRFRIWAEFMISDGDRIVDSSTFGFIVLDPIARQLQDLTALSPQLAMTSSHPSLISYLSSDSDDQLAAVFLWEPSNVIEIVAKRGDSPPISTDVVAERRVNFGESYSLTTALDGSLVRMGWISSARDARPVELNAEIDLESGTLLSDPRVLSANLVSSDAVQYVARVGGGIDVVKAGSSTPGFVYDPYWFRADNPMAIYLDMPRSMDYSAQEPIRLGAGGTVRSFVLARSEGGKLVILWAELGPLDMSAESYFADAVEGLFWAVLDC